jgi:hypothetical protein
MGMARKARRMLYRSATSIHLGGDLDVPELCRRIDFIEQMKPKNRNKPRNVKRLILYRAALARA